VPTFSRASTKLALLVVVLAVPACGRAPSGDGQPEIRPSPAPAGVVILGSVSLDPGREYEVFRPFADYLAAHLGEVGIGTGKVVVTDSLSRMVEALRRGTVDIYIDSPFPVAFVCERGEARPILRRWKRGSETYHSVVFARSDSGIESADDLRGHVIAFGEPFSTTGFLLPKATLVSSGLKLVNYADSAAAIPSDQVGYVFSNDAENTLFWVLKNKVSAGAVNADYFAALAGSRIDELRIILSTEETPRNVVCVRSDLDPEVVRKVEEVLLAMNDEQLGQKVLRDFEQTTKFDRFPTGAARDLARVHQLLAYIEEDVGQ
jgi:phosphonate transport system substrate-binding protein